jgi:iron complex outermembrane receptor protein
MRSACLPKPFASAGEFIVLNRIQTLKSGIACTIFCSVTVATSQSYAQTEASSQSTANTPENVLITGSLPGDFGAKSGIPLALVPQSVQVLDAQDLDEQIERGARSIEDVLRTVPSATVAGSRVGSSTSNTLRLRGYAAQLMRNGIRQRFYEGVDSSALSNVDRIEVLKGPSGVLYGQSGVGGIISIITKQPTDTYQGSVALTGGSFDQKMATIDVGGPLTGAIGFRLTGEIERSGTFVDFMDLDRENVGLALAWRPTARVSAHVVAEYLHRETLNNPGLPTIGTVISNGVATVKRSTFLGEPSYSLQENDAPLVQAWVDFKLSDTWTLTPRVQYSEFNNTSKSTTLLPPVAGQPTLIQRQGRNAGERDTFYVAQLDLSGRAEVFGVNHELLLGAEYSADRVNFRMEDNVPCGVGPIDSLDPVYGCGPPTSNFGFKSEAYLDGYAIYVQDQITLTDAWNVIAGVRYSDVENDNNFITAFFSAPSSATLTNTTWQLGTTYALGGGVSLFGGYNTGYDLEWVIGARSANGAPFKPETSDQAELGVRLTRNTLRGSLSVFRIHRNDVAVPDPLNLGFQIQEGQFRVQGLELEGEWSPTPGWWLQGGYAYLDGTVSRTTNATLLGAQLAETPKHSATASTRVTFGRVELRAGANYVGSRKMVNGGAVTLPDYMTFDLGVGTSIGRWRLDAALTNVFDKVYYFSDNLFVYSIGTEDRVLPGDPRTFSLRVSHSFGGAPR